jgi:type VI secretion system secreted protein VgrG
MPTQVNREVAVTTALGPDVLLFKRMSGSEQLGRLSEYRVELLSTRHDLKIADVLGKPMGIHLDLPNGMVRHFHGIVTRFACTGWEGSLSLYEATVHPWLWLLTRSSNCRIFQEKSVVDIVKAVWSEAYGSLVNLSASLLSGTYPTLPYCVQYRETDFNFVCRLLEHAGIYFYFTHDAGEHTMVLADSYGAHSTTPYYGKDDKVKFSGEEARSNPDGEAVHSWVAGGEIQASSYSLNDFDFEKAAASTSGGLRVTSTIAAAFEQQAYEMYDYPGGYVTADEGRALARGRMEGVHGQCEEIVADTNARGLFPGGLFALAEHPRDDQNREYLVTAARYQIVNNDYASGSGQPLDFRCEFRAVGKEHNYRPPRITTKPVVQGPQTAMVVGKAGEEIWTDKYGRIKLQFHWDRDGLEDEKSSCWVRVSQAWAGKGWGAMFIPRVGMEVVVDFLEGDPDRPLVTGCVYNSDAMPPYGLPGEQTKSTIKTNSSKGGGGYNEIRLEDKKGDEEIFVQAEKDMNRVVKNNDTLKVGFEKADKGDQTIGIKNDQSLDVGHDQLVHVANDQTVTIDGDQKITIGKTCVIEATTSIELKVGGSSIKIEPAKITIKSAEIAVAADANAEVKAGAMMTIKSGAIMTIEGALVKIN